MVGTFTSMHDFGSWLKAFPAFAPLIVTAGGGDDNLEKAGITIDRDYYDQDFLSGVFYLLATTASLGPATSTITVVVKDSADDTTYDEYETYDDDVYDDNGTRALEYKVDLAGARRYVRIYLTVNFSAGSVDTNQVAAVFIAGGFEELPVGRTEPSSA